MRLKDKLIRRDCPACGVEITLGNSSLGKKINCPKCCESVIISEGEVVAPAKPKTKKSVPEKHVPRESGLSAVAQEFPAPPPPVVESRIPLQTRFIEEVETAVELEAEPTDDTGPVIYCLCKGVLKKRRVTMGTGAAQGVCCMYLNGPAS